MSDKEVKKCTSQANCKNGKSSSLCLSSLPGKYYCNDANNGYYIDKGIVKECKSQPNGCSQYDSTKECKGPLKNFKHCMVHDSKQYNNINGFVVEKGCSLVAPTNGKLSPCQSKLESKKQCSFTCNPGFTLSGNNTCDKGKILTKGKCIPNPCDGVSKDSSGKLSISSSKNPHNQGTDEFNVWKANQCQSSLQSGKSCNPSCPNGYTLKPTQSSCLLGTLTQAKCHKNPCKKGSIVSLTLDNETKTINLHKELNGHDGSLIIPCGGDNNYKFGNVWTKRYQGNITLTCDKGNLNIKQECKVYKNCPQSWQNLNCSMGNGGTCLIKNNQLTCDCKGNYVGDGLKNGTKCSECINSLKNICNTHNDSQSCKGNCSWINNKCELKTKLKGFEIQSGNQSRCVCNSGFYIVNNKCDPYAGVCLNGVLKSQNLREANNDCGKCNSGYVLDSKQIPAKCLEKSCDASVPPQNGSVGDCTNNLQSQKQCQIKCNPGYTVTGKTSCKLGKLTKAVCNSNPCDGISKDYQGNLSLKPNQNPHKKGTDIFQAWKQGNCGDSLQSGQTCIPICNKGYKINPIKSSCLNGKLTQAKCIPIPCDTSQAPLNGTIGDCPKQLDHGKSCQPTCNQGYTVSGKSICNKGILKPTICNEFKCSWDPKKHNSGILFKKPPPSNKLTQTELYKNHSPYLQPGYYKICGECSPNKKHTTEWGCLNDITMKNKWTKFKNCDFDIQCLTKDGLFSVVNSPRQCLNDIKECKSPSIICSQAKVNEKSYGKKQCIEEFTGSIEGFTPQDHKCSIINYDICKNKKKK